jgi:uncharacterized protein YjbI with pentapeptide repeats
MNLKPLRQTLLARYQSGDRAFGASDLYHAKLEGIAVPDADFEQANLCGVNLARANLRGPNYPVGGCCRGVRGFRFRV